MFSNSFKSEKNDKSPSLVGYFLDDERQPSDVRWKEYPKNIEWNIFTNGKDFLRSFYNNDKQPDIISLDYELNPIPTVNPVNGDDVLGAILVHFHQNGWEIRDTEWFIHSRSKEGKPIMERMIKEARREQRMSNSSE